MTSFFAIKSFFRFFLALHNLEAFETVFRVKVNPYNNELDFSFDIKTLK